MSTETQPQSALDLANEEAIRSLLARANLLRMREQWNDAIAACTEAIRRAPRSASARSLLGEIYEAQGKLDDAVQWFGMALEIDPTNAGDRVRRERLVELQRVRLRTQDIAAQSARPAVSKEPTLEWIDRIFPPGRSDSLPRLILAMSLTFAVLIAACGGFIYFYVIPHHQGQMAARGSDESGANLGAALPSDLSLPSPPVLMTPTGNTGTPPPTSAADAASARKIADSKNTPPPQAREKPAEVAVPSAGDAANLRQRLAPLLNNAQTQLVDVTPGQDGAFYLDLGLLPTGTGSTEQLREQALRAASQAAHAAAGLIPGDMLRVIVRVARIAPAPTGPSTATTTRAKAYEMVFQAEAPLRYFRDVDVATLTPSDLIARFRNAQWFAGGPSSPTLPTTTTGTTGSADNAVAPASSPAPVSGTTQTTGSGTSTGTSGGAGTSGTP